MKKPSRNGNYFSQEGFGISRFNRRLRINSSRIKEDTQMTTMTPTHHSYRPIENNTATIKLKTAAIAIFFIMLLTSLFLNYNLLVILKQTKKKMSKTSPYVNTINPFLMK